MANPEPMRGEVWDVRFPFGAHPAVVLSVNALNSRLGHVAAIPVTGTEGPEGSHVTLAADAGLTLYPQSYADITTLQAVARSRFRQRRGLLDPAELRQIETRLRTYLGL